MVEHQLPKLRVASSSLVSRFLLVALLAALLGAFVAGCGGRGSSEGRPERVVGAVEDRAKSEDADVQMRRAAESGFGAVALSAIWTRGATAPSPDELAALKRATKAAATNDVRPVLAVYQFSGNTPVTPEDRDAFASYTVALLDALPDVHDVIVGNEPNLNLFWMPQFDESGGDAAAAAYARLLRHTYTAVKRARDDVRVVGGALAPRGSDDPDAPRQTHSPTRFIRDLARTRPPLDAFAIHPYGETPAIPPTLQHPRTTSLGIADYPRLRTLLREAFGRDVPVVYGEYGVETTIPPGKRTLYTGREVVRTVSEATQARSYREAIRLAGCQPTVELLLLFHVQDEPRLEGLQSGVRYADGSPKASLAPVREAARGGLHCPRSR